MFAQNKRGNEGKTVITKRQFLGNMIDWARSKITPIFDLGTTMTERHSKLPLIDPAFPIYSGSEL